MLPIPKICFVFWFYEFNNVWMVKFLKSFNFAIINQWFFVFLCFLDSHFILFVGATINVSVTSFAKFVFLVDFYCLNVK